MFVSPSNIYVEAVTRHVMVSEEMSSGGDYD